MSKLTDWVKKATDDDLVDVIAGERPAGMPPRRGRMSKHTPGPWIVVEPDVAWAAWRIVDAAGPGVCNVTTRHGGQDLEATANAKLIAAAPDMLSELERLLDVVGEEDVSCVEAVIAKAEGDSTE